jgi:LacI family transcriptional regulator
MRDLGFKPNRSARRLASGHAHRPRVAGLMPFFSTTFYFTVAKALSVGLAEAGCDFVLHNVRHRDDKLRVLDRLAGEGGCEALLLCSMGASADRLEPFTRLGIPIAAIDYPLPNVPSVTVDNIAGGALAARHLLSCGAQRLALINGPASALAFRERERGFAEIAGSDAPIHRSTEVSHDAGRSAAETLLTAHGDIDGLVCANDILAVGALDALRRHGRRVPNDVQVIGFDDQPLMDVIGLTTVHQPMERFGTWGADAVLSLLTTPERPPSSVVLPLRIVERSTTRAPDRRRTRKKAKTSP